MASSFPATASAAVAANNAHKPTSFLSSSSHSHSMLSFSASSNPTLRIFSKGLQSTSSRSPVARAQLNKVAVDGSKTAAASPSESDELAVEAKDAKPSSHPPSGELTSEDSASEFISLVSDLVKLVDSRDIVELQLKQLDCELLIRKKEALPQPASSAPVVMMQPSHPQAAASQAFQVSPPPAVPAPATRPAHAPSSAPSSPAAKSAKSSLPSIKCPMAGTFYRSPAPSEPPFVKVGDKVQKGQVLCIIEAMKLMNEIEADQSGTIVEIIAEDGKPVSADTPLFLIEP